MNFFMRTSYDEVIDNNIKIPSICNGNWWIVAISEDGLFRYYELSHSYDVDEEGRINIIGVDLL